MAKPVPVPDDSFKQRMVEAMRLHTSGNTEDALKAYEQLRQQWPTQPILLKAIATIYLAQEEWQKSASTLRQLLALDARQPEQIMQLAQAEIAMGADADARETLTKLLLVDPANEKAIDLLCDLCLKETPPMAMGESPLYALIGKFPKAFTLNSVGIKLSRKLDDRKYRLTHFENILKHGNPPDDEKFFIEYGAMLRDNQQFERAFEVANEALKVYPNVIDLLRLRGSLYITFGQHDKAMEDAKRVYEIAPENHQAKFAIGLIKMLVSDQTDGYEEFAGLRDRSVESHRLDFPIPEWQGEDLKGKHLVLWANEGIGDVIMYGSFLPYLKAQGARISAAVPEKLSLLLSRSFPEIPLMPMLAPGVAEYSKGRGDYWTTISQFVPFLLPKYNPADHPFYLKADAKKVTALHEKYRRAHPGKKLIGISWYTKNADSASRRNIPLAEWEPLLALKNVQFISLQYGDHKREIAQVEKQFPGALYVDPEIDAYDDVDGLAAQMLALDEVITIDNTTIHLAGALGVRSTLLLSKASEWRWGLKRADCRWYESVHVVRQKGLTDWQPELAAVAERLKKE